MPPACCVTVCGDLKMYMEGTTRQVEYRFCEQNTLSHCMYRREHFVHTAALICYRSLVAQVVPSMKYSFHLLFRAMSHDLHSTPSTLTSGSRLITTGIHCADSRCLRGDGFTDPEPRTGYEPNRTVDNPIVTEQEIEHSGEEGQIPEIEDKFSLPYNQSLLLSSTQDYIESRALASPRYLPEREASAERPQNYHSEGEGWWTSSCESLNFICTGKPVAWLSHQKRLGQDEFSEREQPVDVSRGSESVFRC